MLFPLKIALFFKGNGIFNYKCGLQIPEFVKQTCRALLCGYSKINFNCSYFQVLKAVVAQFDAGELITQREMVSARVNSELTARAEQVRVLLLKNCSIQGVLNIWSNITFWIQVGPFQLLS